MLPYLQDTGRMCSILNPQDWQSWISCQSSQPVMVQKTTKKLHHSPCSACTQESTMHLSPCTGWLWWGDREKQFRWQLSSVSKHRMFSPVISSIHFTNIEEYLVRICLCDQGDIRNLNVNVFCSLSFNCYEVPPDKDKCPFLCWVTEDFRYRPLFGNKPSLQKGFKINTPHCGLWLNDKQIQIDQNITFLFEIPFI